jgi:hypothetical protein
MSFTFLVLIKRSKLLTFLRLEVEENFRFVFATIGFIYSS